MTAGRARRRVAAAIAASAVVALALAAGGCGSSANPGQARPDVDWPWFGGTATGTRSSPLDEIDTANVRRLGVAWSLDVAPQAALWETYPVVVGRTMYVTTNEGEVLALDATTGARRWTYTPDVDLLVGGALEGPAVHRGVTVAGGRVFLATHDDHLIALDATTGRPQWDVRVADPRTGATQNSPPAYLDGRVFVGSAGADAGVRGFVAAYDAATGRQRWRFWTVPAPGQDWMPEGEEGGGGHVWMPPTADPATGTVYAGTGNRSPAISSAPRTRCDEWTDATIALDARTGRLKWGHSEQCGDVRDMDSGQPPAVFPARRAGAVRSTVGHANKDGTYWLLDAVTGKAAARSAPLVPRSLKQPSAAGARVCPGALGGVAYSPAAVRGATVFQPAVAQCMTYLTTKGAAKRGPQPFVQVGGGIAQLEKTPPATGVMVALDTANARVRWRRAMPAPMVGGALATAGGLVFGGSDDGRLYAFDAATGRIAWRGNVGLAFGSAPLTYRIDGTQYVAVAAGGSSLASLTGARTGARLVVLKLGGRPLRPASAPRR